MSFSRVRVGAEEGSQPPLPGAPRWSGRRPARQRRRRWRAASTAAGTTTSRTAPSPSVAPSATRPATHSTSAPAAAPPSGASSSASPPPPPPDPSDRRGGGVGRATQRCGPSHTCHAGVCDPLHSGHAGGCDPLRPSRSRCPTASPHSPRDCSLSFAIRAHSTCLHRHPVPSPPLWMHCRGTARSHVSLSCLNPPLLRGAGTPASPMECDPCLLTSRGGVEWPPGKELGSTPLCQGVAAGQPFDEGHPPKKGSAWCELPRLSPCLV